MHLPVAWSSASDVIITVVVVCCYYCNHGTHATCHSWPVRTAIVSRETDTPHYPAIEGGEAVDRQFSAVQHWDGKGMKSGVAIRSL